MAEGTDRPLAKYRVVELAGPVPMHCGKIFADLGAEVIKVEPSEGDWSRCLPPFGGEPGRSLYWAAYGLGKRGVTLDLEQESSRALLCRLAGVADVLIEAYPPGYLAGLGLGYEQLRAENPGLIMTSITPFGQTGPLAGWRGSDLVQFAMSGYLYMTGLPGGTPIKPSAPYQTWFHAGTQAAAATMLVLRQRRRTGRGAHVDQAMRDTGMWMLTHTYQFWDLLGVNLTRQGASRDMGGVLRLPSVWQARDGYIVWLFQSGHIGGERMRLLVGWMAADGMAPEWLQTIVWETFDLLSAGQEAVRELAGLFAAFFRTKTRAELYDWSLARGVMLAPVQTLPDVLDDAQLAARETLRTAELGSGLGTALVPGPPVRMGDAGWEPRGPAPAMGEHNAAIYGDLLGLCDDDLQRLVAAHAI